jgi:hypothetical protein
MRLDGLGWLDERTELAAPVLYKLQFAVRLDRPEGPGQTTSWSGASAASENAVRQTTTGTDRPGNGCAR